MVKAAGYLEHHDFVFQSKQIINSTDMFLRVHVQMENNWSD